MQDARYLVAAAPLTDEAREGMTILLIPGPFAAASVVS